MGARVEFGSPTNPRTYPQGRFSVVYDNNGKDLDSCKPLIDNFAVSCTAQHRGHSTHRHVQSFCAPLRTQQSLSALTMCLCQVRATILCISPAQAHMCMCVCVFYPQGKVDHYVFVSSAGAYKASDFEPCHYEGDPRKSSAGHVEVEKYLQVGLVHTHAHTWTHTQTESHTASHVQPHTRKCSCTCAAT